MSHPQDTIASPDREYPSIMPWLLAITEVVNSGGRLAPQKVTRKLLKEWVDTYGPETCWQGIKHFSKTFGMADALAVEALFQKHPDLPILLRNEEEAKKALSQWFEKNSTIVSQAHQLSYGLGKLVPPSTTSKFAEGEATPEQREILGRVSQILGKDENNEESSNLHTSL